MSEKSPYTAQLKQLDQLCDEFESLWDAGSRPSVSEFVSQVAQPLQAQALHDLLLIEVDHRRELGERPNIDEYSARHPDSALEILRVFEQLLDTQVRAETVGTPAKPSTPELPSAFGDYELIDEIARGGMGAVFKARQRSLDRLVAIKVILAGACALKEHLDRFATEVQAAAKLRHPGIVAVYEVGRIEGQPYFSMEYVAGSTVAAICDGKPIAGLRAARYLKAAAEAVHYAHEQGVLHRDIKPSNILIDATDRVQITDFGLAKQIDVQSDLTAAGQILGTPHYMSPEQARGEFSQIDWRSDIYSLGAVLYKMLCGRPPHRGESTIATLMKVIHDDPKSLREINPQVDPELVRICEKCLARRPQDRYPTALDLAQDLGQFLSKDETTPHRSATRTEAASHRPTHRRLWVALGGLAAASLLAATVIVIKVGKEAVTVQTDQDANVSIEADRVTVESGDKTVVVQANDARDGVPAATSVDVPSPFDGYRREDINEHDLAFAGGGDPSRAPQELVGVIGSVPQPHAAEGDSSGEPQADDALVAITDYELTPDAARIVTLNSDGTASVWDVAARTVIHTFENHPHAFVDLAVGPNGRTLATLAEEVRLFDLTNGRRIPYQSALTAHTSRLWFSPQGRLLATVSKLDPQLVLHDAATGETVRQITLEGSSPNFHTSFHVEFTPDESQVAITHDRDQFIRFFDVNSGQEARSFELQSWTETMDLSADGTLLAASGWIEWDRAKLFDLTTNEMVREFDLMSEVAISSDNRLLATHDGGTVRLWPLGKIGTPRTIQFRVELGDMRFAPDNRHLLVFHPAGAIFVLRISE